MGRRRSDLTDGATRVEDEAQQYKTGELITERCRVVRLIGRGGMGEVYEAENTWTGRKVAVKVLLPGGALDSRAVGRFLQEAQAATKLAHRNIVDVLDMGRDSSSNAIFLVQELLVGESLRAHLEREGPRPLRAAAELLLPVMGALAAAHRGGIVHRDVKPENVFLHQQEGEVIPKLIDFGLAKAMEGSSRLTSTGQIMGTPLFMAPEQCEGRPDIDERADVWAVGVMLYEALTGALPFDGATPMAVMFKVAHEPPAPLEAHGVAVHPSVAPLVLRALNKPREERYASMEEFATALLECEALRDDADAIRDRHRRSLRFLAASVTPPAPASRPEIAEATNSSGTEHGWSSERQRRSDMALGATVPSLDVSIAPDRRRSRRALFAAAALGGALVVGGIAAQRATPVAPMTATTSAPVQAPQDIVAPRTPPSAPAQDPPRTVVEAPAAAAVVAPTTADVEAPAAAAVAADAGARAPATPPRRSHRRRRVDDILRPIR